MTSDGMNALLKMLILSCLVDTYLFPWRGIKQIGFFGWLKEFITTPFTLLYLFLIKPFIVEPLKSLARKFGNS